MKRFHNIYQDINILKLMSVSFTDIYVYWILYCVSLLTVPYFEDLQLQCYGCDFFVHGKNFCYWI